MGQDESSCSVSDNSASQLKVNHPIFAKNTKIGKQGKTMVTKIPIPSQQQYHKWVKRLQKIKQYEDQSMFLPLKHFYEVESLCGDGGFVQAQYQNFPFILEDKIEERSYTLDYFSEADLWYLLYSLVSVSENFKNITSKIGDVRPSNVFISQESSTIKIANICSWPCEKTNYQKKFESDIPTYISPEQLKAIESRMEEKSIAIYRAECFSIGLTLLSTATLKKFKSLYIKTKKSQIFNKQGLEKIFQQFWNQNISVQENEYQTYSISLKTIIISLCQVDCQYRPLTSQILKILEPYLLSIWSAEKFEMKLPFTQKFNSIQKIYSNRRRSFSPQRRKIFPEKKLRFPERKNIFPKRKKGFHLPLKRIQQLPLVQSLVQEKKPEIMQSSMKSESILCYSSKTSSKPSSIINKIDEFNENINIRQTHEETNETVKRMDQILRHSRQSYE